MHKGYPVGVGGMDGRDTDRVPCGSPRTLFEWSNVVQQALNGGSVTEALVDMTGGVGQKLLLTEPHVKEMIADGRLWQKLKKYGVSAFSCL